MLISALPYARNTYSMQFMLKYNSSLQKWEKLKFIQNNKRPQRLSEQQGQS